METPKVFESEYRFCLILWENEPIRSGELVKLCRERLGWMPTTTYTVIKRLSERGVLINENSVVRSLVSKEEVQASELDELVEKTFEGSLPAFIAAFTKRKDLSEADIDEVQEMIEDLGIPVLVDMSSFESNPLGRMEWIKFFAEMVGKEEEAKAFFDEQKAKVEALNDFPNTEKTVAFFYISTDGKAVVRSADDYIPTMIDMAGARYIFKDVTDEAGKSTIPMTIEAFYDIAQDADYIVYNASIDSSVKTLDDLLAKDPIMSELKAVKEGNCWSSGGSMYQRTDIAGDMIMDFHTLFTSDDPEGQLQYITKLE